VKSKIPNEAVALNQARLDLRASLVSLGILTVEELESLAKKEAITTATQRLIEQMRSTPTGKHRKRA
jgi:flagellar biosynthesis regulator FlaF